MEFLDHRRTRRPPDASGERASMQVAIPVCRHPQPPQCIACRRDLLGQGRRRAVAELSFVSLSPDRVREAGSCGRVDAQRRQRGGARDTKAIVTAARCLRTGCQGARVEQRPDPTRHSTQPVPLGRGTDGSISQSGWPWLLLSLKLTRPTPRADRQAAIITSQVLVPLGPRSEPPFGSCRSRS